jgi:hypothetical protein
MKRRIPEKLATNALLIIFILIMLFHVLVLLGIIPFDIVWGGRLKSKDEMIPFEITSIALNSVMLGIVMMQAGLLKVNVKPIVLKIAFWCMFVLFAINTVGNIFSNNELERLIFTPLTLLLSVFSLRLAIK